MQLISLQDDNYVKVVVPQSGAPIGTLYFGHTGNHYVALKLKKKVPLFFLWGA